MALPGWSGRPPGHPAPGELSWPVVLGLGALALLFPLAELTGLPDALGPAPTVLLLSGLVAATWIGVVGFGRVPRPVLTLTLAGTAFGVVLVALPVPLRRLADVDGVLLALGAGMEIARSTVLGALAGVLAGTIQKTRSRRR